MGIEFSVMPTTKKTTISLRDNVHQKSKKKTCAERKEGMFGSMKKTDIDDLRDRVDSGY